MAWWSRAWSACRPPWQEVAHPADMTASPLLSPAEMAELHARAGACATDTPRNNAIAHRLLGEQRSVFRGRGFDFEESRPWQNGDELRFMNWRATARTGEFTMKVFREDRRPGVCLLVDRRRSMRFGTRRRLKVAQALRVAALLAFLAERRQYGLGGVVLDTTPRWLDERPPPAAFDLLAIANAPCPPLSDSAPEPALAEILRRLAVSLTRGTRICLISDFHDLDEACEPILLQLAAEHELSACQIVDPAELALPAAGRLGLHTADGNIRPLDSGDDRIRETVSARARAFLDARLQRLDRLGLPAVRIPGDVDAIWRLLC